MNAPRLLVVDDDVELCEMLVPYLSREGFAAEAVHDGPSGVAHALAGEWALLILDVMLPQLSGLEVLRRVRATSNVPVIMLTALGEEVDRIVGLELGADDYLAKPFSPRELVARVRAVLRRYAQGERGPETVPRMLRVGDLTLNVGARRTFRGGEEIRLTGTEYALLEALVRDAGQVLSRDVLSRAVLGRRAVAYDRSLDVHASSLRRKLGPLADGSERIRAVRGTGYFYANPVSTAAETE